jgi:hypothetical protein
MKTFSKAFLILLSFSLLVFTGCEKDEADKTKSDLIGTWTIKSVNVDAKVGELDFATYLMNVLELPQAQAQGLAQLLLAEAAPSGTITINEDNTYSTNIDGETENGTWSLSSDGKTLTVTTTDDGITISDDLIIKSLTASELVLTVPGETMDVDLDDDGIEETSLSILMELVLSK